MRIGMVSAEYPPSIGGVGDHTSRLARELRQIGHHVDVLTSIGQGDVQDEALRVVHRWDWRILWQIPRIARERHWDVLHIQYQPAAYGLHGAINLLPLVLRKTWRQGRPALVTTFHDLRFPYLFPKAGTLRPQAVRLLAVQSDAAIVVADEDLSHVRRWAQHRGVFRHIPLGNQLDAPPPDGFASVAWRATHGLSQVGELVGYLGFVNQSKGVDDLVEALGQLVTSGRDMYLIMIGEQLGTSDPTNRTYRDHIRRQISQRGLQDRVRWTGYLQPPEIAAWLRSVDLVALPFVDGASLRRTSLIAAWADGAPVITTTPNSASTWLANPEPAIFVSPRDPGALAMAMERVLEHADCRAALRDGGLYMAQRFAWPAVTSQTVAVYEAAIERAKC